MFLSFLLAYFIFFLYQVDIFFSEYFLFFSFRNFLFTSFHFFSLFSSKFFLFPPIFNSPPQFHHLQSFLINYFYRLSRPTTAYSIKHICLTRSTFNPLIISTILPRKLIIIPYPLPIEACRTLRWLHETRPVNLNWLANNTGSSWKRQMSSPWLPSSVINCFSSQIINLQTSLERQLSADCSPSKIEQVWRSKVA